MSKLIALGAACAVTLTGCIIHVDTGGWHGGGVAFDDWDSGPRYVGNGVAGEQHRDVAPFDAVHLQGSFDARVTVGSAHRVVVHGDANLLEHVNAEVRGGSLELWLDEGSYDLDRKLWVEVEAPDLRAVALSGSGDVAVSGLERDAFAVSLSGSGDVKVSGCAGELAIECAGSGDVNARHLPTQRAAVTISGSSDVSVEVEEQLDVSISGSGDVRYGGSPRVHASISGSGDVRPR